MLMPGVFGVLPNSFRKYHVIRNPCYIFEHPLDVMMPDTGPTDLPSELLLRIFHELANEIDPMKGCRSLFVPLLRVCRSWNHLATPLLYRRLSTYFDAKDGNRRQERLLKTLCDHPTFYSYVRELHLEDANRDARPNLDILEKVSPHITSLHVCGSSVGDLEDKLLPMIKSSKLEKLAITGEWCRPALEYLLANRMLNSLHTFKISTACWTCNHFDSSWKLSVERYTSSIQHLEIDMNSWPPKLLQDVVSLPRSLLSLKIDVTSIVREWTEYNEAVLTTSMQRALNFQRESLQKIELSGFWPDALGRLVDLSAFPNITSLSLHQANVFKVPLEEACRKLLCPKLERIAIDMRWDDQQHDGYDCLEDNSLDWLLKFIYGRRENLTIDRLQEIHIVYHWNSEEVHHDYVTGYIHESPWPTEHLLVAAERLKELGVRLSWPEPLWNREVWETISREQTVPGYTYETTKEERLKARPSTEEERENYWGKLSRRTTPTIEEYV